MPAAKSIGSVNTAYQGRLKAAARATMPAKTPQPTTCKATMTTAMPISKRHSGGVSIDAIRVAGSPLVGQFEDQIRLPLLHVGLAHRIVQILLQAGRPELTVILLAHVPGNAFGGGPVEQFARRITQFLRMAHVPSDRVVASRQQMRLYAVVAGDFVCRGHPHFDFHDAPGVNAVVLPEWRARGLDAAGRQPAEDLHDLRL